MSKIDYRLIKQLYLFLAVAEEEHFGRAAKRLGMSQPPLTEQIKILEQALKLTLFERSRRGTTLSPAGKAIFPQVKRFVEHMASLEQMVKEVAQGKVGVMHIGAITSAMFDVVPEFLAYFKQHYPDITIFVNEIDSAEAISSLLTGKLDMAFVRVEGDIGQELKSIPLTEALLGVALHVEHPMACHDELRLSDLKNEAFVMSSRRVNPTYFDILTSTCIENGFNPRVLYEVRSVAAQIAYVSCGQGVALVPLSMNSFIPGNVRLIPLKESINIVTAALVWNPANVHPLVEHGVKWLTQHMNNKNVELSY